MVVDAVGELDGYALLSSGQQFKVRAGRHPALLQHAKIKPCIAGLLDLQHHFFYTKLFRQLYTRLARLADLNNSFIKPEHIPDANILLSQARDRQIFSKCGI